ncbi:MAG: thiamine pyrophosphate-dependent enzyme, partial [Candidatus Nanopelagicales bacterium]
MTSAPEPQSPAVQLLTPEGELVNHESYSLDLTHAQYKYLYREMVSVRRLDQEATALQRQGELGLWASSLGQEAAQVGSAFALEKNDFAFP